MHLQHIGQRTHQLAQVISIILSKLEAPHALFAGMACKPLLAELRAAPLAFRLPSGAAALTSSEAPAYFNDLTHALTKYLPGGGLSGMLMRQGWVYCMG